MAFTAEEVANLRRLGLSTTAIEKAVKVQADLDVLAEAGVTQDVVAALVEAKPPTLSDYADKDTGEPKSDWAGSVINVPMPDLGVLVKVTITVDNPDAFPELAPAIAERKVFLAQAKAKAKAQAERDKAGAALASAPRLSA